ncbi:unnamed protein product [Paramecium sonneborni]|uniref:Uncharacterized protein n=1 Tax=Paramecium sonneborni TaxID=65129 RepID=A0A8S1LUR2_9CILI|nr:unnamed protein product [Paramecium sonneborni]
MNNFKKQSYERIQDIRITQKQKQSAPVNNHALKDKVLQVEIDHKYIQIQLVISGLYEFQRPIIEIKDKQEKIYKKFVSSKILIQQKKLLLKQEQNQLSNLNIRGQIQRQWQITFQVRLNNQRIQHKIGQMIPQKDYYLFFKFRLTKTHLDQDFYFYTNYQKIISNHFYQKIVSNHINIQLKYIKKNLTKRESDLSEMRKFIIKEDIPQIQICCRNKKNRLLYI